MTGSEAGKCRSQFPILKTKNHPLLPKERLFQAVPESGAESVKSGPHLGFSFDSTMGVKSEALEIVTVLCAAPMILAPLSLLVPKARSPALPGIPVLIGQADLLLPQTPCVVSTKMVSGHRGTADVEGACAITRR